MKANRAAASVKRRRVAQAHNRFEPSAPDSVRRVGNLEPFQALLSSKFEPRRRKSCSVVSSLPPRSERPPRSLRLHRLLRRIILTLERSRRCLSAKEQQELRRRVSKGKQELRRKVSLKRSPRPSGAERRKCIRRNTRPLRTPC